MNFYKHLFTNFLKSKTMKKNYLFLASAALMAAASCAQMSPEGTGFQTEPSNPGMGTLIVNVKQDAPATRALSGYMAEQEYEKSINKVEILVFDASTKELNGYFNVGKETSPSINVTSGSKHVYAIVNNSADLTGVTDEDGLNDIGILLDHNSTDGANGFVMAGMADDVNVTAGGKASPTINVKRFTSRIALVKVTNNLPPAYGSLVIEDVFLTNVVANQNLGGDGKAEKWYNIKGRIQDATDETQVIGVSDNAGTCPGLTHKASVNLSVPNAVNEADEDNFAEPKYLLYAYPNSADAAGADVLWNQDPFPGDKTRLVLTATVDGKYFYYPVVIENLERNKSYDVSVKISGFGVDDPDAQISKGAISFTVKPDEWDKGDAIDKDL